LIIGGKGRSILRAPRLLLVLFLRQFDWSEPLIRQGGDKILIVVIGLEAIERKKVRPRGRGFRITGMNRFKQVIIDDVKLRADVAGAKISDKTNGASVQRRSPHVLALSRPRLPLGYLSSILEPRL
jgi:hypothetical protein